MKIVIAGNGPTAISAIETIRGADSSSEIVLLTKEKEKAYSPCFLYHYISGELSKDRLYIKEEDFYARKRVNVLYGISLEKVDPSERSLKLSDGKTLSYDRLLIAIGAEPLMPEIEGIKGEGVFFFKTLEDAERIISVSQMIKEAAVIGGGFIGLEIAEALKKRGLSVTVIEKEERVLPRMLSQDMAETVKAHLIKNGINIITGKTITSIERKKGAIAAIRLSDGKTVPAQAVIISTGMKPNIKPLEGSGIKVHRGILVNEGMETNIPHIYAAGDVAELEIKGVRKVNPVWINATIGGFIAGANMAGIKKRLDYHLPAMNLINLFGLYIFSAGTPEGETSFIWKDKANIKKIILDEDNNIKGLQLIGPVSLKGGLYLNLLGRKGTPALLRDELSYGHILFPQLNYPLIT